MIYGIGRWLLLLTFIMVSASGNAAVVKKQGIIKGVVIDFVSKEPLLAANIYIRQFDIGTSTDNEGKFLLRLDAPVKTVMEISYVGYEKKEIAIELADGEEKEFTIYLNPRALVMSGIMVVGDKVTETVFNSTNFVTVTTEEEIKTANAVTTADILTREPGVLVQKTTNAHGSPIIRGLLGKYILLLYNGIRLNKPTFRFGANQYLNTVSAEALHRIEITRGPTSVLYGSDAIGGTINLITEPYEPDGADFRFIPEFKFGYSSANDSKDATIYLKGSKKTVSFSGSLNYKNVENLDPGGNERRQNPTGWDETNGNLNLFFEPVETHTFEFNYLSADQNDVPRYDKYVTGEYEKWIYEPQSRRLYALTYTYSPPLSWLHRMKWNISFQDEHEGRTQQKTGSSRITIDDDKIKTFGTFVNLSSIIQIFGGNHWVNWGAEYYRDKVKSGRVSDNSGTITVERGAFPDNSVYDSFGVFVQDNYPVNKQFEASYGLRYSYFSYGSQLEAPFGLLSDTFKDITGFTSLRYKPHPSINIVGSYARGFRAPNFNDTVVLKVSNSGVDAPSPGLIPESSQNYELGIKIENPQAQGGWFIYYNRMSDLVDRRFGTYKGLPFYDENDNGILDPGEVPIFQKFNVGKAVIYGTELYVTLHRNDFSWFGQVFYTFGENKTEKEPMSRIPPLIGRAGLQWNRSENLRFEASVRFAAKQDRLSLRDILDTRIPGGGTPGYTTFDLKGVYTFSSGRLVIAFENIFDELYKTHGSGIYSPGRSFAVSYQFSYFKSRQ